MKQHTYQKKFIYPLIYPILLTLFTILCVLLMMPADSVFGSQGDWFSQHAAIAEQFRTIFYETGRIFPDFSLLGAGSNIYDFSYYGFLRPDILISFFLPRVPMVFIISAYAVLELTAGTNLCYFWLKRHVSFPFFAFLGAILFSCGTCFYHARHQIMFVNYMPFLILALWGIERLLTKAKTGLLILSLFFVYLHSYYFAPSVLVVCTLYFIHCLYQKDKEPGRSFFSSPAAVFKKREASQEAEKKSGCWGRFVFSILLSIGMAAILLLPTALDLLSTQKDAGTPASLHKIFSVNLSMESLLYHPYGCGLTILCLYTLLLSIRRKSTRLISIFLLLCLTVNTFPFLLSGFLYVRYKVLIPLVPLLTLLCARTMEELVAKRERHSLFCALGCLIPAAFSDYPKAILADFLWVLITFLLIWFCQRYLSRKHAGANDHTLSFQTPPRPFYRKAFSVCLLFCLPPALLSVIVGQTKDYISASDQRQSAFTQKELQEPALNNHYRYDCLADPFANVNVQPLQGIGRTTMYSSVTDSRYADFYYNTMKNPIRIRNRVALITDANPFFSYLMGIRYIQTTSGRLPWGYARILEKGNAVIAENDQVPPVAYASTSFLEQTEYEKLGFPYNLEALTRYTIIPDGTTPASLTAARTDAPRSSEKKVPPLESTASATAETFLEHTKITPVSIGSLASAKDLQNCLDALAAEGILQDTAISERDAYTLSVSKKTRLTLPLSGSLENRLLICSFSVTAPSGDEVTIDINKSRNKLSGKGAPYPNHNDTFTYLLSSNEALKELDITLYPGDYTLSDLQFWIMDTESWGNAGIHSISFETQKGNALLTGTASLEEDGYFVTSFPFRKGYEAYVDGQKTAVSQVNQGFVGFPLDAGVHEILLFYTPPGKTTGALISLLSLLLFLLTCDLKFPAKHP